MTIWLLATIVLLGGRDAEAADTVAGALSDRMNECRERFAKAAEAKRAGKAEDAISLFSEAASRCPELIADCYYGLAASYAANKRPGMGCDWLVKAVDNGYLNLDAIENDPDLASIRKLKKYKAALPAMRAKIAASKGAAPPVTRFGPKPYSGVRGILVLLHADRGSADEVLQAIGPEAASAGWACAAPEGPVAVATGRFSWGSREDAFRRIQSAYALAQREFGVKGKPLYVGGQREGADLALNYTFVRPRDIGGAVIVDPWIEEGMLMLVEGAVAAPPVLIVESGTLDKDIHARRRRVFERLRTHGRPARLVHATNLSFSLPGGFRWLTAPSTGG